MAKKRRRDEPPPKPPREAPFHAPFRGLEKKVARAEPPSPRSTPTEPAPPPPATDDDVFRAAMTGVAPLPKPSRTPAAIIFFQVTCWIRHVL